MHRHTDTHAHTFTFLGRLKGTSLVSAEQKKTEERSDDRKKTSTKMRGEYVHVRDVSETSYESTHFNAKLPWGDKSHREPKRKAVNGGGVLRKNSEQKQQRPSTSFCVCWRRRFQLEVLSGLLWMLPSAFFTFANSYFIFSLFPLRQMRVFSRLKPAIF